MIHNLKKGSTATGECYTSVKHRCRDSINVKMGGKLAYGVVLLHDNAPAYKSRLSKAAITEYGFIEIDHPPYSPNLKKALRGTKFTDYDELVTVFGGKNKLIFLWWI